MPSPSARSTVSRAELAIPDHRRRRVDRGL
jgi:hypothetical protein